MDNLRPNVDRIGNPPVVNRSLISPGLAFVLTVFGLSVPVWLGASIALVWRHADFELSLLFLAVFAGVFVLAGLVYAAGYLGWLIVRRWLVPVIRRAAAGSRPRLTAGLLALAVLSGLVLILAASLPLVTISARLTAYPARAESGAIAPEYEAVVTAGARALLPLLMTVRQATETRGFGQPLAAPQPARPLLAEGPTEIPIDPLTALGILAAVEAGIALTRRGRIGLSGHALILTGLAGLGYLVALPLWASAFARFALDAEAFVLQSPADRLSLAFVTAGGFWLIALLSLVLLAVGLLLNARQEAARPDARQ